jgi:hypothetical protein
MAGFKKTFGDKSLEELVEIIERNRQENRRHERHEFDGLFSKQYSPDQLSVSTPAVEPEALAPAEVRLTIYGEKSPFIDSIVQMFSRRTVVSWFDEPERTINFVLEYRIGNVLLDFDAPTDTNYAMDIFVALRTLHPLLHIMFCTKNDQSLETLTMLKRGGHLLKKPVFKTHVQNIVSEYLHNL